MAEHIKKEFDQKYGSSWHCIVGTDYGSNIGFQPSQFIYFYIEKYAVLLFKADALTTS